MTMQHGPCFKCKKEMDFYGHPCPITLSTNSEVEFNLNGHHFCKDCENILKESKVETLKYIKNWVNIFIKRELQHKESGNGKTRFVVGR